jgi:DNA-binding transcriptional LysR family regulator
MSFESQVTLKQLRAFVAVYRLQRLAPAAERLSITVSAVSVLIRQLESSIGAPLFDRRARSLVPTPAAHDAIGMAERVLQDITLLGSSILDLQEHRRGQVRVAVTPAVASALLPAVVRRFLQAFPDVRLVLEDCAPDQFLGLVIGEQVDFGIGTPEHRSPEIEMQTLVDDRLCVVCPNDHPLTRLRHVRWLDLQGVPLIAVRAGYGVRRSVDAVAARLGVQLNIAHEVGFLSSALWMTSSGLGVSIWPSALLAASSFDNLVACPLVKPTVSRSISLVTKLGHSLSAASTAFVHTLQQHLAGKH